MPKSQLDPEDFQDFGFELEDLQIVSGNLKTIKDHVFKHVRGIKKLDFSENRIDKIEDDAFVEVNMLKNNLIEMLLILLFLDWTYVDNFENISRIIHDYG